MKLSAAILTSALAVTATAFDKWQRMSITITHNMICYPDPSSIVLTATTSLGKARLRLPECVPGYP